MGATVKTPSVPKAKAPAPRPAPAAASSKAAAVPAARTGPSPAGASTLLTAGPAAVGEMDLSSGSLQVPAALAETLADGVKLDVPVRLPGLAQGSVQLRWSGGHFSSQRDQGIALDHPALAALAASTPMVLVLHVVDDAVTGWVGLGQPGPAKGNPRAFFDAVKKGGDALGWLGLSGITIPSVHNVFAGGLIDARAEGLAFTVGGFLSGTGNAVLDNKALAFDGGAKVQIPGGSSGELLIKKDAAGLLAGRLDITVSIGKVNGTVTATLTNGFVSVLGGVGYDGDRLSGKLTLIATDEATARDVTLKKPEGGADVTIELPGPDKPAKPGKRAFCGWGQLNFQVTDWLAGTATVLVNSQGQATIIGEIAPPKEFILFEQKEWIKRIFKAEIRAGYGIPVVGQVGLFASISLDAIAKVGPGKLYKIKLAGAYSTDPRVAKQLSIEASLNISAFAGLRARAEAGLLVTILAHDIKAGVGLDAIAGVRGYVEATPKIGMRELTPGGKRQYYIQGHMEIAAQPILGFSGDLFVAIETPWWSPLSDKRWTWPLFSLEYPLPGEFGIGADVDYVLGSKQWPTISFGEVNFDSSKFLTDVMNDNTDKGSGGEAKKPGEWAEGLGGKGKGGAKNKGGSGKGVGEMEHDIGPIGEEETFSDGSESHRLWFEQKGSNATLQMASSNPGPVESHISKWDKSRDMLVEADQKRYDTLVKQARKQLETTDKDADQVAAMKVATKKAKEVYEKNKGKKGKKVKGKNGAKELNKLVKTNQRNLKGTLTALAVLMHEAPFENIERKPAMRGGAEALSVVNDKTHPGLRIAKRKGSSKFDELLDTSAPLVAHSVGGAGKARANKAQKEVDQQIEILQKFVTRGGRIKTRNQKSLEKPADKAANTVSSFGNALAIAQLQRARQFLPLKLGQQGIIKFLADPAKVKTGLYRTQFLSNMREQLNEQARGIRKLSVEEWLAQRALFTMDQKAFRALDNAGRKEVVAELKVRAAAAKVTAEKTLKSLDRRIEEIITKHTLSNKDYEKLGKWTLQLLRAENRQGGAEAALLELGRISSGAFRAPSKEILKARYDNSTEPMRTRILGRQDKEKAVRDLHKNNLDAFLKRQKDWSRLAKTGSDLAILHRPDQVAGGYDAFEKLEEPPAAVTDFNDPLWITYFQDLRKFFGPAKVNSLIGTQWKGQIEQLAAHMKAAVPSRLSYPLYQMDLKLKIVPRES